MAKQKPNTTNKIDTTNKIIIPKSGKDSLSDEARKKLVEDLQNISPEEIEAMGENFEKMKKEKKENERKEKIRKDFYNKDVELVEIQEYGDIGGKPVFKLKEAYGVYAVYRGGEDILGDYWSSEIGEIKDIGGKPAFAATRNGRRFIMRGEDEYYASNFEIVNLNLEEIGGKLVFKLKDTDGTYVVIRGDEVCGEYYKEIGEIKDVGGKPAFWAIDENGKRHEIHGYDEIS